MDLPPAPDEVAQAVGRISASATTDEEGRSVFPNGDSVVVCTSWANALKAEFGDRVCVFGFFCDDNPAPGMERLASGHDFVVLDGHLIIDPWLFEIEAETSSPAINMRDPENVSVIRAFYGSPLLWTSDDPERSSLPLVWMRSDPEPGISV